MSPASFGLAGGSLRWRDLSKGELLELEQFVLVGEFLKPVEIFYRIYFEPSVVDL